MPKRPTLRAREAEKKVLNLLESKTQNPNTPLPSVRQLGQKFGISFATISRILQRFVEERRVWQHPNGRFFRINAASQAVKGLPIVLLGRQIQHWSRLYREILEGVSEICASQACPLVFLSSDKLVRHESLEMPPRFIPAADQNAELERLESAIPRLCAGILFDHLWDDTCISDNRFPPAPRMLLARPSDCDNIVAATPDFAAGAHLILQHLHKMGCERIHVGIPFYGDQAVDATLTALRLAAATSPYASREIELLDCSTPAMRKKAISRLARVRTRSAVVCLEDNIASLLWHELTDRGALKDITLISMQGTGGITAPIAHLRYDYRLLGREAVVSVIERRRTSLLLAPRLLTEDDGCKEA